MPTVPNIRARTVGSAGVPNVRISPNVPDTTTANIDFSGVADVVRQVAREERVKADQIAITDADGQLAALETRILHAPKTGLLNRRGQTAFTAPDDAKLEWEKGVSEISAKMATETQRMAFNRTVTARWAGVDQAVQRHVSGEMTKFDDETTQSHLANERSAAILSFNDPVRVRASIERQQTVIAAFGQRNGMPEEWVTQQRNGVASKTHLGVIETMVVRGMDRLAQSYYTASKDEIGGEDATKIEQMLETASTDGEAIRGVDAVWASLGPKDTNDPVKVADMEAALREKYKDDPKVSKAATQELRSRATTFNAQQTELNNSHAAKVLGAFNNGSPLSALVRMPEYLKLSGTEQEKIKSYVVDRGHQLTERRRAEQMRNGFQAYWQFSNPERLAKISENEILAAEPALGQELVADLLRQKRILGTSETKVRDAVVDNDMFNQILRNSDINPSDKTRAWEIGELKYKVESAIDRAQEATGKQLTRSQKEEIVRRLVDEKVMIDVFGPWNSEKIAATVQKDQRNKAYVPLPTIQSSNKPWIATALNWMRTNGAIGNFQGSDDDLSKKFANRLERAYGTQLTGGSQEEVYAILRGK